jgi:hypothetical protein
VWIASERAIIVLQQCPSMQLVLSTFDEVPDPHASDTRNDTVESRVITFVLALFSLKYRDIALRLAQS